MIATKNQVANQILTFGNGNDPEFNAWPNSIAQAAIEWGDVVDICCKDVIPATNNQVPARAAFITIFKTMNIDQQNGYQVFTQALWEYANIMAAGMVTSNFTGIPPSTPFVFNMQGMINGNSETEANNFAEALIDWFKTGKAVNISSGVTVNWT